MSTKTVPANLPADITAQNEELLRIVEKQRIVIQNLQKSLALMTDERDNLLERNQDLEQERLVNGHGNNARTSDGPVPPPRSPYRQNTSSPSHQQSQDAGCATVWEPTLPSTYSYDRKPALEQGGGSNSPPSNHHQEPPSPPQLQTSRSMTTNESARIDDNRNGYISQQQQDYRNAEAYKDEQQQRKHAEEQARRQREEQAQRQREQEEQARLQRQADEQARRQREQEAYVEEQTRLHRQAMEEQMRRQRQDSYNESQPRRQQRQQDTHTEEQTRWHRYQSQEELQQHHAVSSSDIHQQQQQQQQETYYAYTTDEPQSPALPSTPRIHEGQHGPFTPGPMAGISVKILGSNIFTNDKNQEVIAFTISVRGKTSDDPNAVPQEQWRIQKHYSDFLALDAQLKSHDRSVEQHIGKLPDRALFATHAPNKVDQRKLAMEQYLQHAISSLQLTEITATVICEFLSSNVIDKSLYTKVSKYRQGYLSKRGKNFGGWKSRFFILDGPDLKYYESEDGQYLGSIRLTEAQIGKQKATEQSGSSKDQPSFKHGFIIVEPKKSAPGGLARHVLCASSDDDRDAWVEAMSQHVDQEAVNKRKKGNEKGSSSKNDIKPVLGTVEHQRSGLDEAHYAQLMNLTNMNRQEDDNGKKDKNNNQRKGFWSKKMFAGSSNNNNNNRAATTPAGKDGRKEAEPLGAKQVFGIPLEDAIRVAKVKDEYEIPAIVYRCIDYLEAKNAIQEEGIYRLSGSASKIRSLKAKFNEEGDVDLLNAEEYYDIHAVSGLLKMWFRELPGNVLTNELLKEFLNVMDLIDRRERIHELGRLVSLLPLANYTLLRTLSVHLIRVVQNAGQNKMTMRNVGIVFSATLGIPTGILHLLLAEFDYIFWTNDGTNNSNNPPASPVNVNGFTPQQQPSQYQPPLLPTQKAATSGPTGNRLQSIREEGRSNRNSVSYMCGAPQSIVGLERATGVIEESDDDDLDLTDDFNEEEHHGYRTAERQPYLQPQQMHANPTTPTYHHHSPPPVVDPHHLASQASRYYY
ncbi:RhoGAP-domain-containing protein [Lichtheimia hyalospora FSU 10163]|nr:RhoGAP-domain-containing protein [Lichtheimia hyalospora FSU 10163]